MVYYYSYRKGKSKIDANHESITSASGNIDTLSQTLNAQRKHFEDIVNNMKLFSEGLMIGRTKAFYNLMKL